MYGLMPKYVHVTFFITAREMQMYGFNRTPKDGGVTGHGSKELHAAF
jgi:hypothetical protein